MKKTKTLLSALFLSIIFIFSACDAYAATAPEGCSPASETFTVTNSSADGKWYTFTTDQTWLTANYGPGFTIVPLGYLGPGQTGTHY